MIARFCGVQREYSRLRQKTTTAIACRTGSCVATQAGGNAPSHKWVDCLFGCFPHPFYGGGGWVPICGFCSDLDQNRAVLWSKSEMKHLKHPKHLKHLKHCLWMLGLLFCQHFKELDGKVKDGVHKGQDQ